jgi:hypothetical protein
MGNVMVFLPECREPGLYIEGVQGKKVFVEALEMDVNADRGYVRTFGIPVAAACQEKCQHKNDCSCFFHRHG